LFLSSFRLSAERGGMSVDGVRDRLAAIFVEQERASRESDELKPLYEKAQYIIHVAVDGIILGSKWGMRSRWPLLEERYHGTAIGGKRFFDLLGDPAFGHPDLQELFYLFLGLGFQGQFAGDPQEIEECRKRIYLRMPHVPRGSEEQITPQVYESTQEGSAPDLPLVKVVRLAILAVGVVLLLSLGSSLIYASGVAGINETANAISAGDGNK